MPSREQAAARIGQLFDDGGMLVLAEGGEFATWEQAFGTLPDALFQMAEQPPLQFLTLARDLWGRNGDLRMATAVTRGLIRVLVDRVGREHPETIAQVGALGTLALRAGRTDEGREMLEQAFHALRSVVGGRDLRLAVVAGNLGLQYAQESAWSDAEHCLRTALKIRQAEAPATAGTVAGQLAEVLLRQDKVTEGLDTLEVAWLAELDAHGERHPNTVRRLLQLAQALSQVDQHRRAVPLWRTLDEIVREDGNPENIARVGFELGCALLRVHRREEGIRRMREALEWTRAVSDQTGRPHPELAQRLTHWADLEIEQGHASQAEGLLREAVEVETRVSGTASPQTARRQAELGTLLARMGRTDEALGYLATASSLLASTEGCEVPATLAATEATLGLLATKVEELVAQRDKVGAALVVQDAIATYGPIVGYAHRGLGVLRQLALNHRIPLE